MKDNYILIDKRRPRDIANDWRWVLSVLPFKSNMAIDYHISIMDNIVYATDGHVLYSLILDSDNIPNHIYLVANLTDKWVLVPDNCSRYPNILSVWPKYGTETKKLKFEGYMTKVLKDFYQYLEGNINYSYVIKALGKKPLDFIQGEFLFYGEISPTGIIIGNRIALVMLMR